MRLPFIYDSRLYYESFVGQMSPLETKFMSCLIRERLRGGLFVSKDSILSDLYVNSGREEPEYSDKALDVIVYRLREMLEFWPITIVTKWGYGYALHFRGEPKESLV